MYANVWKLKFRHKNVLSTKYLNPFTHFDHVIRLRYFVQIFCVIICDSIHRLNCIVENDIINCKAADYLISSKFIIIIFVLRCFYGSKKNFVILQVFLAEPRLLMIWILAYFCSKISLCFWTMTSIFNPLPSHHISTAQSALYFSLTFSVK